MSYIDPFDAATEAGDRKPKFYYGRMEVTASFIAMIKGQAPQVFNGNLHDADTRRTQVHLICNLIDAMNLTQLIERKVIADFGVWPKVVWPSLRDLGLKNVRDRMASGRRWRSSRPAAPTRAAAARRRKKPRSSSCGAVQHGGGDRGHAGRMGAARRPHRTIPRWLWTCRTGRGRRPPTATGRTPNGKPHCNSSRCWSSRVQATGASWRPRLPRCP